MNRYNVTYTETVIIETKLSAEKLKDAFYEEGLTSAIEETSKFTIVDRPGAEISIVPFKKEKCK